MIRAPFDVALARRALIVLAGYYVSARLGMRIPYLGTHISMLWLPTGIAVAAFYRWGPCMAVGVFLAVLCNGFTNGTPLPTLLQICVGNTCGPWLAARLLLRGGFDRGMARHTDIALLLWAGAAGMLVTSSNGICALMLAHMLTPSSPPLEAWFTWWVGDYVGMLLAGVPLLTFSRAAMRARARHANANVEILALLLGVLVIAVAAFARELPLDRALMFPLLSVPFVLMAMLALRHGIFVSSVAVLGLALLAVAGTASGFGPFAGQVAAAGVLSLWGYVVALSCITMLICAVAGELASSQKRMLALFTHTHDGLLLVDENGCIAQANPAAASLLGADAQDLRGTPLWHIEADVSHADESALLRLVRPLGGPAPLPLHAGRLRRSDGLEFDGECQVATYTDSAGSTQAHVVLRDVTTRLRAESDRLAADAAVRANRAKTEFLSRVSHELRTPLNAVLGFAQLLERDATRIPLDHQGNIGHILDAGTHLLHLIDEVLDLSRIEAGGVELTLSPVCLEDVLNQSLTVVRPAADSRGVTLRRHSDAAGPGGEGSDSGVAPRVMADTMRLHQVLVNLLDNAVKYTERGGRVCLQWQPTVDASGRAAVAIEVSDTGIGLDADQLGHLFEPFNRLGAERSGVEGTGIGLVISRRFVELMDGQLMVESQPGLGSVFRVILPAVEAARSEPAMLELDPDGRVHPHRGEPLTITFGAAEDAHGHVDADPDAVSTRAPARAAGLRRVLYIEDNEVNQMLVEAIMKPRPDLTLTTAGTGQTGLARARSDPPDLVLIDMQLPDMTGMELFRLLRRAPEMRGVRCVALSADAMPESIAEALAEGFSDYLTKPLKLDLFNACLDRHLTAS